MTVLDTRSHPVRVPVPHGPLSEEVLLGRLEALVPMLQARAAETERLRHLPQETIDDAITAGFVGGFRPTYFGGSGLGLSALANGARILAHGCGASAWTLVFLAQHAWMLGRVPMAFQEEAMGNNRMPMIAAALGHVGTATKVDGGYRVNGRSEWNSAIYHSEWTSVKAIADGQLTIFYMPVADVVLDDGWHTAGMRGTDSDAFTATDVFVPDHRVVPGSVLGNAVLDPRHEGEVFLTYPYLSAVAITCSAVAMGMTEAAVEHFRARMENRVLAFSDNEKQAEQPFGQMRLGEVTLKLRMARELWDSAIRKMDAICGQGLELSTADRVDVRGRCALAVQTCRDLINVLMNAAGGSSYFLNSPLQRIQRDIEVLKSHAYFDWDRVAQLQGKIALGLAPGPKDLV